MTGRVGPLSRPRYLHCTHYRNIKVLNTHCKINLMHREASLKGLSFLLSQDGGIPKMALLIAIGKSSFFWSEERRESSGFPLFKRHCGIYFLNPTVFRNA